jgi:hypothetical protein
VISVFEGAQLFPGYAYMTGKAFAPYVEQLRVQQGRPLGEVLSDQPFQGFIVVEDSAGGIGHYQELVQRYNLFPGAEIIYYELADPAEDI